MNIANILNDIDAALSLVSGITKAVSDAKGVISASDQATLDAKLAELKAASANLHEQIQSA